MGLNLEDKLAIHELLGRAALGYDERDTDMLSACFANAASFTMRIAAGDLVGPFEGQDNIMQLMTDSMANQTDVRRHVISNIVFGQAANSKAHVISNLTLLATENGAIELLSSGIYRDDVEQIDGVWQITKRHLDLDKGY